MENQGSVFSLILFLVFSHSLALLLASHGVDSNFYAEDCQISLPIPYTDDNKTKFLQLLSDIKTWMRERRLKLNKSKTEIMLIKDNLRTMLHLSLATWMLKPLHLPLLVLYEILA